MLHLRTYCTFCVSNRMSFAYFNCALIQFFSFISGFLHLLQTQAELPPSPRLCRRGRRGRYRRRRQKMKNTNFPFIPRGFLKFLHIVNISKGATVTQCVGKKKGWTFVPNLSRAKASKTSRRKSRKNIDILREL